MGHKKGYLHLIILSLMAVIFLVVGLAIWETGIVKSKIREKSMVEQSRMTNKGLGNQIKDMSDYLTEQFRRFIYTEKEEYLELYEQGFKAVDKAKIEEKEPVSLSPQEWRLITAAKNEADSLLEKEQWAMRLMEEGKGIKKKDLPLWLQSVSLSEKEQNLTEEEKKQKALEFASSPEYEKSKELIHSNLMEFQDILDARKEEELNRTSLKMQETLRLVQVCSVLAVLLVAILVAVCYIFAIRPILKYLGELEQIEPDREQILKPCGLGEVRTFAERFNRIYLNWKKQRQELERMNSIDNLTGIANRAALDDYIRERIEEGITGIGLLMMDVDNFKSFNDGFGHLVGDQVLIKMGQCFHKITEEEGGITGRLGGEEFIIIILEATPIAKRIMEEVSLIEAEELGISDKSIHVTVSVGSTIWKRAYEGDLNALIHQADTALYQAKGRGKNQHIMYSEKKRFLSYDGI